MTIHVAVGVIVNAQGKVLIAKRAEHQHQGGLWEFPGGKVEAEETVQQALSRELKEELGIDVKECIPLLKINHHYVGEKGTDKQVLLDVWKITEFGGEALNEKEQGLEGQPLKWVSVSDLDQHEVPQANKKIIIKLQNQISLQKILPAEMMVTGSWKTHIEFEQRLTKALEKGIRCVQFRAHQLSQQAYMALFEKSQKMCNEYDAILIANTSTNVFQELSREISSTCLHLSSKRLMNLEKRPVEKNIVLGASCHNVEEIQQAEKIGVDYISLSPVFTTATHPDLELLGLDGFSELQQQTVLPVFALGGIQKSDNEKLKQAGAYGIAAISQYWLTH